MHCCGVHNYEDFNKAVEFVKYTREEGIGQVIPESCCMLEDSNEAKNLFIPKDPNCITTPTVTNSYINQVCNIHEISNTTISFFLFARKFLFLESPYLVGSPTLLSLE